MGKKKSAGRGNRKQNYRKSHKKGFGKPTGNHNKGNVGTRFQKPNEHQAKDFNPIEEFHSRMEKFNLMEKDIGVTEYVGKTPGFNAIIKTRYSDFQVNEIDLDGNVVKLTDTSLPTKPEQPEIVCDEVIELVGQDIWNGLMELSKGTENASEIEMDAESLTKAQRSMIHKCVKESFGSTIVSSTITKDDKKFFKFAQFKKNAGNDKRIKWPWPGEYVHFVVYKENVDTMKAAGDLSQGLHANTKAISYAGTKDRRAKTTQWFCIRKREPESISKAADMKKSIHVGNFVFKNEPLKLGHLSGNRFRIALRHIVHPESDIELSLQSLKDNGFINYYGLQRFGNNSAVPTHQVGLALIKGQFKEACELILKPREGEQTFLKKVREHWWQHRDAEAALKFFYKVNYGVESKLLAGLARHGSNDFVNALNYLPRNMLLLYIHSYQSLIWNEIASKRIKLGTQLLPGDLVLVNEDKDSEEIINDDGAFDDDDEGEVKPNEETPPQEEVSAFKSMVKPLDEEDIKSGKYSIFDLVLPLPGHDITYPTNESGQWYVDRLAQDELTSEKLKTKQKTYSLCGAYRKVLVKPKNVSWYFTKYNSDSDDLIQSDLEELRKEPPPKNVEDGQFKALILDFCLPSATYATMLLREVFKGDTSASSQIKLEADSISRSVEKRKMEENVAEDSSKKVRTETENDDEKEKVAKKEEESEEIEDKGDNEGEKKDKEEKEKEGEADSISNGVEKRKMEENVEEDSCKKVKIETDNDDEKEKVAEKEGEGEEIEDKGDKEGKKKDEEEKEKEGEADSISNEVEK
ncbi:Pseudouridylate synthase 7 like [Pseudolycoriella hygida]|uniref:Pseudouridylate synthase 7 like n=1 Tax=Pseudolycoriella hygida TaxID=35572 RepID=A0A9Q0N687_9DIPT|nr:Pseudouridylate synthase 7 like [Pseudolycoriella hygida]